MDKDFSMAELMNAPLLARVRSSPGERPMRTSDPEPDGTTVSAWVPECLVVGQEPAGNWETCAHYPATKSWKTSVVAVVGKALERMVLQRLESRFESTGFFPRKCLGSVLIARRWIP